MDVSNPAAPVVIATTNEVAPPEDIEVFGTHVLVADAQGMSIVDVSDPMNPFRRAQFSSAWSDNAFKITSGGVITQIIDASGDGTGNTMTFPFAIAVDSSDNVNIAARFTNNAFRIRSSNVFADGFESGDTSAWAETFP